MLKERRWEGTGTFHLRLPHADRDFKETDMVIRQDNFSAFFLYVYLDQVFWVAIPVAILAVAVNNDLVVGFVLSMCCIDWPFIVIVTLFVHCLSK